MSKHVCPNCGKVLSRAYTLKKHLGWCDGTKRTTKNTRDRILDLIKRETCTVREISKRIAVSAKTVEKWLKIFLKQGLVKREKRKCKMSRHGYRGVFPYEYIWIKEEA